VHKELWHKNTGLAICSTRKEKVCYNNPKYTFSSGHISEKQGEKNGIRKNMPGNRVAAGSNTRSTDTGQAAYREWILQEKQAGDPYAAKTKDVVPRIGFTGRKNFTG